ncbi:glycine zipper 2TM domain-containing protein [Hydrogenobaculum sp.]
MNVRSARFVRMASIVGLSAVLFSCAQTGQYSLSPAGQQGAAVGGILGTTAGVMLDQSNRWRGGVIGGVMGAILGGTLGQIANQAAQQAATQNQPVQYSNGPQTIQAIPQGQAPNGCQTVTTKYYEHGQLVKTETREVCPGQQ